MIIIKFLFSFLYFLRYFIICLFSSSIHQLQIHVE